MTGGQGKYGKVSTEKKDLHDDEPVFLIRATDPLAVQAVIDYARRAEKAGCKDEHTEGAFDQAMAIAEYQRHNPERVKALPD